jgi:hypothetical protein
LAERVLGKDEVTSSILVIGSKFFASGVSEKFVSPKPRRGEGGGQRASDHGDSSAEAESKAEGAPQIFE